MGGKNSKEKITPEVQGNAQVGMKQNEQDDYFHFKHKSRIQNDWEAESELLEDYDYKDKDKDLKKFVEARKNLIEVIKKKSEEDLVRDDAILDNGNTSKKNSNAEKNKDPNGAVVDLQKLKADLIVIEKDICSQVETVLKDYFVPNSNLHKALFKGKDPSEQAKMVIYIHKDAWRYVIGPLITDANTSNDIMLLNINIKSLRVVQQCGINIAKVNRTDSEKFKKSIIKILNDGLITQSSYQIKNLSFEIMDYFTMVQYKYTLITNYISLFVKELNDMVIEEKEKEKTEFNLLKVELKEMVRFIFLDVEAMWKTLLECEYGCQIIWYYAQSLSMNITTVQNKSKTINEIDEFTKIVVKVRSDLISILFDLKHGYYDPLKEYTRSLGDLFSKHKPIDQADPTKDTEYEDSDFNFLIKELDRQDNKILDFQTFFKNKNQNVPTEVKCLSY